MQDSSDPENILNTSAFQSVIFANRLRKDPGNCEGSTLLCPGADECIVRLRVWCDIPASDHHLSFSCRGCDYQVSMASTGRTYTQ